MKVAFVGEYSGFHLELARGLWKLGHEAHVFASGDDFKKIESTHRWLGPSANYRQLAKNLFFDQPRRLKATLRSYDLVQFVNPDFVLAPNHLSAAYLGYLAREVGDSRAIKSLAVVGCEARVLPVMQRLSSSPCAGCLGDLQRSTCHYAEQNRVARAEMLERFVDHIVPFGSPSYAAAYAHSAKNRAPIMFPLDLERTPYRPNVLKQRVVVLHGLNRPGFKGTPHIAAVFSRLAERYPGRFEFLLPDRLPFDEYMELVRRANVIVDQMHGDALGMNSLYSLATGKVLMTCHDRSADIGGVRLGDSPALHFASEENLEQALLMVSEWAGADFLLQGERGRAFVQRHCEAGMIAKKFLDTTRSSADEHEG